MSKSRLTESDSSSAAASASAVPDRLTGYLVFVLVCVSLAGFIDSFATSFRYSMITYVRQDFGVSFASVSKSFSWIYLGSCFSIIPRVMADIVGRPLMLLSTTACLYGLQWFTGFARTMPEYVALLTLLAFFYKSDIWMLVISEEAPPKQRAFYTALAATCSASGALLLGGLIRRMGPELDAWRSIAMFPIWGLFLSLPLMFFLRETRHFAEARARQSLEKRVATVIAPFGRGLLPRLVVMSLLKMLFIGGAIVFMAMLGTEYLRVENGFSPETVGRIVQFEVVAIVAGWLVSGWLADRLGRHRAIYLCGGSYVVALLCLALLPKGSVAVIVAFVSQIFAGTGVFAILRITTLEIFPTECRASGAAWTDLFAMLFAAVTARCLGMLTDAEARAAGAMSLSTCILILAVTVTLCLPLFAFIRETKGQLLETV